MISLVIERGSVVRIEDGGNPVMKGFWGVPYEHVRTVPELADAVKRYEDENPLEKAKATLRRYKEGTVPVIERCPHCMVK